MTPNPRYANGYRRRQLRARIFREQDFCWVCDEEVDKAIPTPDPMSPEVHEVVAVSLGGDPLDHSNCVLTHRCCNQCVGATGQHRGTCILCQREGASTADSYYGAGASGRRGQTNLPPGVAYITWRTW